MGLNFDVRQLSQMLTNREIALLMIVSAIFVWAMFQHKVRSAILRLIRFLFGSVLLTVIVFYLTYASALVFVAWRFGVWDYRILKDTILIIFFVGFPMVFNAVEVKDGRLLVGQTIKQALSVSALVAFYVNLISLNIFWELFLLAIAVCAGTVSAFAKMQKADGRSVACVMDVILVVVGIIFLASATVGLINRWSNQNIEVIVETLAVSIWLPLLLLPFIYLFSFYIHCESVFNHLSPFNNQKKPKLRVMLAIFLGFRLNVRLAASFNGEWRVRIAPLQTFYEAREVMIAFRRETKLSE